MQLKLGHIKVSIPPKPQVTKGMTGEVFTVIYTPFRSRWFDIVIRNIKLPNIASSPLHCHGVEMYTLCLKGGYDDRNADDQERQVRFGTVTHFKPQDFHTAHTIHGKTGAWTLGIDCRWRGLSSAGFLVDGKFMSMKKFVESLGLPEDVVESVRELTEGEAERRAVKG